MKIETLTAMAALVVLSAVSTQADPLGSAFSYQGRLNDGLNPANGRYDLQFTLYDAGSGGGQIGLPQTTNAVPVNNGLFAVMLDFGTSFDGNARWLEIAVKTNGGASFTTLAPRQPLTPTPFARYAPSAGAAAVANSTAANAVNSASLQANSVTTDKIANGTITDGDISPTASINASKILGGDLRAARLIVGTNHLLGGTYASIAGGDSNTNQANYAQIGGGVFNEVGVGADDSAIVAGARNSIRANAPVSFIGGGERNTIEAYDSVIGGGAENRIQTNAPLASIGGGYRNVIQAGATRAVVAGGEGNTIQANGTHAAIGGGYQNTAGYLATVPGGILNAAAGHNSFAAGYRAKALHQGSFVWADATDADFASTGNNQFLIRASGGVGIGTPNPAAKLDVAGSVRAETVTVSLGLYSPLFNLGSDSNGNLDLGNSFGNGTSPFIDFHYGVGANQDYNVRLINDGNRRLSCDGVFKASGGLIIETRTSDPSSPAPGQIWLRTDL
jgi:hypothetical protein